MDRKILNGWKEISNHIQRGVRTAQRWEILGMPVHRPAHKDRSAVVAFSDELDGWLVRHPDGAGRAANETLTRVHENMNSLASHTTRLASQLRALHDQLKQSLETHRDRIALRALPLTASRAGQIKGSTLPFRPRHTPGRQLLFP